VIHVQIAAALVCFAVVNPMNFGCRIY
jgi:hypothetical protein